MSKSVVSKIRKAAQGLPALQKRLLESGQEAQVLTVERPALEAVYCIFRGRLCVYIGQTRNIFVRLNGHGAFGNGDTVYYIPLPDSSTDERKQIEEELALRLKPTVGTIRGRTLPFQQRNSYRCSYCKHKWRSKMNGIPLRCPNPKCQSPNWRKKQ